MKMAEESRNEAGSSSCSRIGESVIVDYGSRKSSCGYCKSGRRSSISHGLWMHSITASDYQDLLDRGWRRSGCFLYKPEMDRTCCPSYTIRLKASDFVPSKEQLRVSKRMQRFLDGMLNGKKIDCVKDELNSSKVSYGTIDATSSSSNDKELPHKECPSVDYEGKYREHNACYLSDRINHVVGECVRKGDFPSDIQLPKAVVKVVNPNSKKKFANVYGDLRYTCNVAYPIAATLRKHQSTKADTGQATASSELSSQVIAERLVGFLSQLEELSSMSLMACNGHLNFCSSSWDLSTFIGNSAAAFYSVHSQEGGKDIGKRCYSGGRDEGIGKQCYSGGLAVSMPFKKRRLEIHLKKSSFEPEEYDLYRRYQIKVHNDPPDRVTESSYRTFLVDTPLVFVPSNGHKNVVHCGFGSFHQQYLVDGKLIAVGVVDILPRCLSSKYLFWDPELAFLSLGKYTALKEIDWVKEAQADCPGLQYYYLGYYIHSCSKMRYKAAYSPSELLCPLRYQWVPFVIAKPLLDKKPYVVLSDYLMPENEMLAMRSLVADDADLACPSTYLDALSGSVRDGVVETGSGIEGSSTGSDEESDTEPANMEAAVQLKPDINNILIELNGSRFRFKDLSRIFSRSERRHIEALEKQLCQYARLIGSDLADRVVYSIR